MFYFMIVSEKIFTVRGLTYHIRSASAADAKQLSALRLKIDGETEYLDREPGEAFLDEKAFEALIQEDSKQSFYIYFWSLLLKEKLSVFQDARAIHSSDLLTK